ncbi:DUF3422 domain-containing protein [Novosphingobium colocasiae]|uniref:DUF3422 domain-containing protein n=1 Tax=Novosphingobium colocasiae TaxID=1256513 RepID=A0A918PEM4_9SPHN|nr:DUF3422 domain-containing protein [Novosphingobium colocasiae]GGZ03202.1 hypothetical protein GCM10011614_17630 [Novosphingobium colocasiae]
MRAEHPLRRTVVNEMHLRRWPRFTAPASIVQYLRMVEDGDEREAERRALEALGGAPLAPGQRHLISSFAPGIRLCWERHNEATTLTLFLEGTEAVLAMRDDPRLAPALDWAEALPGTVLRATRVAVVADEAQAQALLPRLAFVETDLVSCHVGAQPGSDSGGVRMWSDYVLGDDGFGLLLIAAGDCDRGTLSRTVQGLQELGNYRNLALLGLPDARAGWKVLDGIEAQFDAAFRRMTRSDVSDDSLLDEVSALALALTTQAAAVDFRMSATEAYAGLVEERLADLRVRPCPGFLTLADFTQRRFQPAVRTCSAHRRRTEQLSARLGQFMSLLRTRVETRIENQNARLLASMEQSAARQLRLQQLVEGLSVVALSYYLIALLGHVLEAAEGFAPRLHAHLVLGVLTPVVVLGMWWAIHALKKRMLD